jgi:hypothetical protein
LILFHSIKQFKNLNACELLSSFFHLKQLIQGLGGKRRDSLTVTAEMMEGNATDQTVPRSLCGGMCWQAQHQAGLSMVSALVCHT